MVRFSDIHLWEISQKTLQPAITKISFKIAVLKFCSYLPGAIELTTNEAYRVLVLSLWIGVLVC